MIFSGSLAQRQRRCAISRDADVVCIKKLRLDFIWLYSNGVCNRQRGCGPVHLIDCVVSDFLDNNSLWSNGRGGLRIVESGPCETCF